jgi:hypothetical protein
VLGQSLRTVLIGVVIGGAGLPSRALALWGLRHSIRPMLGSMILLLTSAAMLACYIPTHLAAIRGGAKLQLRGEEE